MTNFERIKSMSADELSEFLENASSGLAGLMIKFFDDYISGCEENIKIWLESEVTHDDGLE